MALKPFHVEDHVDNFYTQSYIAIRVHLVPNYHLAGDPLELPQGHHHVTIILNDTSLTTYFTSLNSYNYNVF